MLLMKVNKHGDGDYLVGGLRPASLFPLSCAAEKSRFRIFLLRILLICSDNFQTGKKYPLSVLRKRA